MEERPGVDDGTGMAEQAASDVGQPALAERLREVEAALGRAEARSAELEAQLGAAREAALAATRRALLAEHAGALVPELVQGASIEELEASVGVARAAYQRLQADLRARLEAQEQARRHEAAAAVPVGASAAPAENLEELSPIRKITAALARSGRS